MLRKTLIVLAVACASGCSSIPDFGRMQATMDRMACATGAMASNMPYMTHNTARMAAVAERMERKSNGLLSELHSKSSSVERTVQNYAQSFLDNDRALIKSLKEIRQEIGTLKDAVSRSQGRARGEQSDGQVNARLHAKLNRLEAKLSAISSQISERNKKMPETSK